MAGAGMGLMARGKTWGAVPTDVEGLYQHVADVTPGGDGNDVRGRATNMVAYARVVKNVSGGALLPGTTVTYKTGSYGKEVDANGGAGVVDGVVDDMIPAAGVANDQWFLMLVGGPCRAAVDGVAVSEGAIIEAKASGRVGLAASLSASSVGRMMEDGGTTAGALKRVFLNLVASG